MVASNEYIHEKPAPSAPVPRPCLSYWQQTTRGFPYLNSNSNSPVPANKKFIVIGSGIAGALATFELIENGVKGEDIVILEAREAVSGASGRNAGHVRPGRYTIQENDSVILLKFARCISGFQPLRCISWA